MHIIDKVIGEFDYGHNIWVQELDADLSCNAQCKCKHRHGHRGKVVAYLKSDKLSSAQSNMVIDFNNLNIMTKFIDNVIDHKYLVDINDPANFDTFHHFWDSEKNTFRDNVLEKHDEYYYSISRRALEMMNNEALRLKYESFVILNFAPTSENLSKWIFDIMTDKIVQKGVNVHKIEWYETPKSRATYYG
jgi:6-pyruvoyltetrahydropterin/6-carboxytetrahydropterin synthase